MAHSSNRWGNAPRVVFQISNLKYEIRNTKFQIKQSRPGGHAVKRANANRVPGRNISFDFDSPLNWHRLQLARLRLQLAWLHLQLAWLHLQLA